MCQSRACDAIRQYLSEKLQQLAKVIDDGVEEWGNLRWQKTAAACHLTSAGKRRRVDPRLREWVLQKSVQTGDFSSTHSANQALDSSGSGSSLLDWKAVELASMRAPMHLGFAGCMSISVAFEGIRIGNPSKEYIIIAASDLGQLRHCVLPPQDILAMLGSAPAFLQCPPPPTQPPPPPPRQK